MNETMAGLALAFIQALWVNMVVETKLAFKLVKTTGHCSAAHVKFLIVLDVLVTAFTDTLASKGILNL